MFTEDLSLFVADFGEPAILAGREVQGIFDAPHELAQVGLMGRHRPASR